MLLMCRTLWAVTPYLTVQQRPVQVLHTAAGVKATSHCSCHVQTAWTVLTQKASQGRQQRLPRQQRLLPIHKARQLGTTLLHRKSHVHRIPHHKWVTRCSCRHRKRFASNSSQMPWQGIMLVPTQPRLPGQCVLRTVRPRDKLLQHSLTCMLALFLNNWHSISAAAARRGSSSSYRASMYV